MIQDYILLAALLAISFDIWNQIKSMTIQRELYSMNDKIGNFDTTEIRMKKVDDIYTEQDIDLLTTQNNAVGKSQRIQLRFRRNNSDQLTKLKVGYLRVKNYSAK